MSGSKRASPYRKSVMSSYENDFPEPQADLGEVICKVAGSRGSSIFEVILSNSEETELAVLPKKFVNLIWVKRNDFVIIQRGPASPEDSAAEVVEAPATAVEGKLLYEIKHILKKDQISHIKKKGLWPSKFDETAASSRGGKVASTGYGEDMIIMDPDYDADYGMEYEEGEEEGTGEARATEDA